MSYELMYGGKDLSEFGIVWDGEATFDKPAVSFKRISIPNRNGDIFDIENRFENIPIKYRCYIPENFKSNLADLVDYLTSFKSYQKLQSTLDVGTYRQAVFVSAISPETDGFARRGGVDLVFDCKPQNYFESGDVLTQITVNAGGSNSWSDSTFNLAGIVGTYNNGAYILEGNVVAAGATQRQVNIAIPSSGTWDIRLEVSAQSGMFPYGITLMANNETMAMRVGNTIYTSKTTTGASTFPFRISISAGTYGSVNAVIIATLTKTNSVTVLTNPSRKEARPIFVYENIGENTTVYFNGLSCLSYFAPEGVTNSDGTLYIDCEMMDCYMLDSYGTMHNYNPYITLYTDFPTLKAGTTTATTTHGVVYIQPRWWRL